MQGEKKRLGELLIAQGWVQQEDLDAALAEQSRQGGRVGALLVEKGILGEQTLLEALSCQLGVEIVEVTDRPGDADALAAVPYAVAKRYRALPFKKEPRLLHVATPEPQDARLPRHDMNHGVVGAPRDQPIVRKRQVGDGGQACERVLVVDHDRLVYEVAAGADERPELSGEQVVQRRRRQEHAIT